MLVGMKNGTILDEILSISFKVKHTIKPNIPLLGIKPKETKSLCPQKYLLKIIHNRFISNISKLEITQMSIKRRMDKNIVVYSYNGIYSSVRKD